MTLLREVCGHELHKSVEVGTCRVGNGLIWRIAERGGTLTLRQKDARKKSHAANQLTISPTHGQGVGQLYPGKGT